MERPPSLSFGLVCSQQPTELTSNSVSIVPQYSNDDARGPTGLSCYDSSDLDISGTSDSSSDEHEESPTRDTHEDFTVTNQLPTPQTPTSLSPAFPHEDSARHASNPRGTSNAPREVTTSTVPPHPLFLRGGSTRATGRILKYAMDLSRAPTRMQEFLAEIKLHFTKEVNLERNSPPIAKATFNKAQERLLCEYLIHYCSTYLHA